MKASVAGSRRGWGRGARRVSGSMEGRGVGAGSSDDWKRIERNLRVVTLSLPVKLLIPALIFPSLSSSTRGLSFYPGKTGRFIGAVLLLSCGIVAYLLAGPLWVFGPAISVWFLGTAGAAIVASSFRPMAFVKPICVRCRLLPVIREHESIHLSGVLGESEVWASMKTRHSVQSLSLEGDPAICSFCPIPKRLSEH